MSTTTPTERRQPEQQRLHTIGAVCARLQPEFPDISISKIRYLEDQGLLTPKRTRGGYRLFSEDDVERLETVLGCAEARPPGRSRRPGAGARSRRALRAGWDRPGARAGARGVRPALAARRRRRAPVPRGRRRHRRRVRPAGPVRHRRPSSPHLQELGGTRVEPARAARRAGASLEKPRAPQGGPRGPAVARGGVAGAFATALLARAAPAGREVGSRRDVRGCTRPA
jgi:hypothetical protein